MWLIDADALMREFAEFVRESNNSDFADIPTWNDAVSLLGSAPTIDAVPVVRCKDCKYSDTFSDECEPTEFPLKCLSIRYGGVYPDWFCEHGQRREDGADNG